MVTEFIPFISPRVQPDTFHRYDVAWRHHVGKHLGAYRFHELTETIIQNALMAGDLSPASRDISRGLLKQIIKLAVARQRCDHHVLAMIELVRLPRVQRKARTDILELAEAMLERARGHWMEGPLWAAMTLGLRKGEVLGLKPGDITDTALILSRQRNHTSGERDRLKHRAEGQTRRIGLPGPIIEQLRSYHRPGALYLFTKPDGSPIDYNHVGRFMAPFQGEKPITFHDLRSAAAVRLIESGVNDHTIMDILGHSAAEMIRRYRDDSEGRTRAAFAALTSTDNRSG